VTFHYCIFFLYIVQIALLVRVMLNFSVQHQHPVGQLVNMTKQLRTRTTNEFGFGFEVEIHFSEGWH